MFKDEKRAFSDLEKELRGMNAPEPEDDLADIYALLDKDYTKQPEPAAEDQEKAPAATGHESPETRELSRELLEQTLAPGKARRGRIPLAIVALLELVGIAAVVVWWLQWLS